ncbi:hypothetical protein J2W43_001840 [Pseudomonas brassicacearum]|uniref:Uncharacterized protein n=1 Tax=Pseudomonas brassicacearum TaxID=930166 RepID=A0AAW8M8G9_9PSED|nr:hypothetical protein [Pseudomonas brassicacearum]MDR6957859.1 hypothetical protein [Pseudomonas brassicacearum]
MVAPFEFLYPIIHKFKKAEYVPTASDKAQVIDSGEILDEPSFGTSVETDEKRTKVLPNGARPAHSCAKR